MRARLAARDDKMVEEYSKRHALEAVGVQLVYPPGDWVIMK